MHVPLSVTLRACEAMWSCAAAEGKGGYFGSLLGGGWMASCRCPEQAMSGQNVVGQGEPTQDDGRLLNAADGELIQAPVSEAGIDAFSACATFVDGLAVRAAHAPSPSGDART